MSEKTVKGKSADQSVLGSLSSTRPTRLARRRDGAARPRAANTAAKPAATNGAGAKAKPAAKPAAAKPKPATPRSRPAAVSAASPQLKRPAQPRTPPPPPPEREGHSGPPSGIELVTTAVQAAGEVAQIGANVGAQILKRAVRRLPRP
jgi:hypothetical protein